MELGPTEKGLIHCQDMVMQPFLYSSSNSQTRLDYAHCIERLNGGGFTGAIDYVVLTALMVGLVARPLLKKKAANDAMYAEGDDAEPDPKMADDANDGVGECERSRLSSEKWIIEGDKAAVITRNIIVGSGIFLLVLCGFCFHHWPYALTGLFVLAGILFIVYGWKWTRHD